jgi:hypothetical protein
VVEKKHKPVFECRDPVFGFVQLSEAEWAIVDSPTFQRLRDIRQLAMAHMVYPGATHTRFEHSLGCLHLSSLIYDTIKHRSENDECPDFAVAFRKRDDRRENGRLLLRAASLLHDLGHAPFSHAGEELMPAGDCGDHEEMTRRLILDTEIAECISKYYGDNGITPEQVAGVATDHGKIAEPSDDAEWFRFLNDIITGELGSDRMDYLLRDASHSGQTSGIFDYMKLISSMQIVEPPKETHEPYRLGLDSAGFLVGEQMVASRYLMYVTLYFHKTKRIYEIHLEEFLKQWLQERYDKPHFPTDDAGEYAKLTDSQVWASIYGSTATKESDLLAELAMPFRQRNHYRLAREILLADNHIVKNNSRTWDQKRFDNLKNYVSNMFGADNIRYDLTTHVAKKFQHTNNQIFVSLDGETRYLSELSEIVSGMPQRIFRGRIYANPEYDALRQDINDACRKWLSESQGTGDHK